MAGFVIVTAARAHDVAVARAADDRAAAVGRDAGVGRDDVLHHGFGDAHGVDGVGGLVGGQAHDPLHPRVDGGVEHVVGALDVGLDRLHREEFAARHLLERRRVEDVVHPGHGVGHRARIAHVADVKFDLSGAVGVPRLQLVAQVVLLLLVAREDADLTDVGVEKVPQHGVAEGAGAAGDEQRCAAECVHRAVLLCPAVLAGTALNEYYIRKRPPAQVIPRCRPRARRPPWPGRPASGTPASAARRPGSDKCPPCRCGTAPPARWG